MKRFALKTVGVEMTGAAVAITSDPTASGDVVIQNPAGNSTVYVGGSDVTTGNGIELAAGASLRLEAPKSRGSEEVLLLKDLYIVGTATDVVRVGYYGTVSS